MMEKLCARVRIGGLVREFLLRAGKSPESCHFSEGETPSRQPARRRRYSNTGLKWGTRARAIFLCARFARGADECVRPHVGVGRRLATIGVGLACAFEGDLILRDFAAFRDRRSFGFGIGLGVGGWMSDGVILDRMNAMDCCDHSGLLRDGSAENTRS